VFPPFMFKYYLFSHLSDELQPIFHIIPSWLVVKITFLGLWACWTKEIDDDFQQAIMSQCEVSRFNNNLTQFSMRFYNLCVSCIPFKCRGCVRFFESKQYEKRIICRRVKFRVGDLCLFHHCNPLCPPDESLWGVMIWHRWIISI